MSRPFGARLAAAVERRDSQVVLGLDPDPARLWPGVGEAVDDLEPWLGGPPASGVPAVAAAGAVLAQCRALLEATATACVAVKPQVACFERLGAPGWAALAAVTAAAREHGLLVLADAKRGDIDVTARAYADGLLGATPSPGGEVPGLRADAVTVNPYLGGDAIAPFASVAAQLGAGLFVLVRTSNPGAADLQDLELAGGGRLWEATARLLAGLDDGPGAGGGLSSFGAVLGATVPAHVARARELLPRAPFLLPGIGAQGGRVEELAPAAAPGRAAALVTAARSVARAHEADEHAGRTPADAARHAAESLRERAAALGR